MYRASAVRTASHSKMVQAAKRPGQEPVTRKGGGADVCASTDEVPRIVRHTVDVNGPWTQDIAATMIPSVPGDGGTSALIPEVTTANRGSAGVCSKSDGSQVDTAAMGKRVVPLKGEVASTEFTSYSFNETAGWYEEVSESPSTATDGSPCSSGEWSLFSEDFESTTAPSSRRSSNLSQIEGAAKYLENLVVHDEDELVEQHLRYERLQSFCDVGADEECGLAFFEYSLEFSASWTRQPEAGASFHSCVSFPAELFVHSWEEASRTAGPSSLQRPLRHVLLTPAETLRAGAQHVGERTVARDVQRFSGIAQKQLNSTGSATGPGSTRAFADARDTGAPGGLGEFFASAESPYCLSCGHSISCSRCFLRMTVPASNPRLRKGNDSGCILCAGTGAHECGVQACGGSCDETSPPAFDGLASVQFHNSLRRGCCTGCASNIYCLTCLNHMQEQTAGLRQVVIEAGNEDAFTGTSAEGDRGVNFAAPSALRRPCSQQPLCCGQELQDVAVCPWRLPTYVHGHLSLPPLMFAELQIEPERMPHVGRVLQHTAAGYELQPFGKSIGVFDGHGGEAGGTSTVSHLLGNIAMFFTKDRGRGPETSSAGTLSPENLCILQTQLTTGTTEARRSSCVCDAKGGKHPSGEECGRYEYLMSAYSYSAANGISVGRRLSPRQSFHSVSDTGKDRAHLASEHLRETGLTELEYMCPTSVHWACAKEPEPSPRSGQRSNVDCEKTLECEQLYSDVRAMPQLAPSERRGRAEGDRHFYGVAAREFHGRGLKGSIAHFVGTHNSIRAFRQSLHKAPLGKAGQGRFYRGAYEKDREDSGSSVGRRDGVMRVSPSVADLVRRDDYTVHACESLLKGGEKSCRGSSDEKRRTQRVHQPALRSHHGSAVSVAARPQCGVDACACSCQRGVGGGFSPIVQCHQDSQASHECSGRAVSSRRAFSGRAASCHREEQKATKAPGEATTTLEEGKPPLFCLRGEASFEVASAYQTACGGRTEMPGSDAYASALGKTSSVPKRLSGKITRTGVAAVRSPLEFERLSVEAEPGIHANGASCKQARFRDAERPRGAETWKNAIDTKVTDWTVFGERSKAPGSVRTSALPPEAPNNEGAREVQREDRRRRQHPAQSIGESAASRWSFGTRATTPTRNASLGQRGGKTSDTQHTPCFHAPVPCAPPANTSLQESDTTCCFTLPGLEYRGRSGAVCAGYAVKRGRQRCVSADSEADGCPSACSPGEEAAASVPLTNSTAETQVCGSEEGRKSSPEDAQLAHWKENEEFYVDVLGARSTMTREAKRLRLERGPWRSSPILAARQGKHSTSDRPALQSVATRCSIESTISTKSGESSSYESSPARTILNSPSGDVSDGGVADAAFGRVLPAQTSGRMTTREHAQCGAETARPEEQRPPLTSLSCNSAGELGSQPLFPTCKPSRAVDSCYEGGDTSRTSSNDLSTDCSLQYTRQGTAESTSHKSTQARPSLIRLVSLYLTSKGVPLPSKAAALRKSHEEVPRKSAAADFEDGAMRNSSLQRGMPRGAVNGVREQPGRKDVLDQRMLWEDETTKHRYQHTTATPRLNPGSSKPKVHPRGSKTPAAVAQSAAVQSTAPASCCGPWARRGEDVEGSKKERLGPVAASSRQGTAAAEGAQLRARPRRMDCRKKYSTEDSSRMNSAISARTLQQPLHVISNDTAQAGISAVRAGVKHASSATGFVNHNANDVQGTQQKTKNRPAKVSTMNRGEVTYAGADDKLQSRRQGSARTGKIAASRDKYTEARIQNTLTVVGTIRDAGSRDGGCKASSVPGRGNDSSATDNVVDDAGDLLRTASLPRTAAGPIAFDNNPPADVSPAPPTESKTNPGERCERLRPQSAVATQALTERRNRPVRRETDENACTVEKAQEPWRRGADGKVLYDAGGQKVPGVWYDNGRRLWRVVFTQGERRRTKGFSLRQYGFEQARHLAIQCKLAMEAGKAVCAKDAR